MKILLNFSHFSYLSFHVNLKFLRSGKFPNQTKPSSRQCPTALQNLHHWSQRATIETFWQKMTWLNVYDSKIENSKWSGASLYAGWMHWIECFISSSNLRFKMRNFIFTNRIVRNICTSHEYHWGIQSIFFDLPF